MTAKPPQLDRGPPDPPAPPAHRDGAGYWVGVPFRWLYQMGHNGLGIVRVLDITKFRPMPHGLVGADHPWVTGINPATGRYVWHENVVFRSPRGPDEDALPMDDFVVTKTGQFLAYRVGLSAGPEELPIGPRRRMPHGISYIHGTSHYNSGQFVFTDFPDALYYFSDPRFKREVYRFVRAERREVLILFRNRDYRPRDYAYFVCCLRTLFPWFCNANGPKGKVLWGNSAPYPAANLITGHWADDVYALKRPGGAEAVVRPPVQKGKYFQGEYGGGRRFARWPEKALAWVTYWRIRMRGGKGGLFFVNRERAYADHLERLKKVGVTEDPIARM
jgi:hypothetical protein